MNYKIQAIFATESEANSASSLLHAAGYRKEFLGYTQNAHLQPESLVEDHHSDKNYVTVFTKNLNRAFKARNILSRIGAVSIKMKHQFSQQIIKVEKTTIFKKIVNEIHNNLLEYHQQPIAMNHSQKTSNIKSKKISDSKNMMLNNR